MPCQPLTARVAGAVARSQHAGGPAGAPRKRKVRPPYNGPVPDLGRGEGGRARHACQRACTEHGAMDAGPGKTGPGCS